jgi:hypothetical protein
MEAHSPVRDGTSLPTILVGVHREHSWYEIFVAIVYFVVLWNAWRCLTSAGPGPSFRQVWEENRTLGRTNGNVKGVTPGY